MQTSALSSTQRKYVRTLIETGSRSKAEYYSGSKSTELLSSPHVVLVIKDRLTAKLLSMAPLALNVLERLMTDENVPAAVRRLAASDLLDRAGITALPAKLLEAHENLSEMPAGDLRDLVARLETELFARSREVQALEVDDAAMLEPDDANPLSVLD